MTTSTTSAHRSNLFATATLGILALIGGGSCIAADREEVRQVVVQYGDLNLSNPRGAAALYKRIEAAANDVCGASEVESRELGSRASVDACVRKAITGAVTTVGRPELFAVYNKRNSAPLGIPVAAASQSR